MSTNSCIAEPDGDSLRGRYCHSDGYPTHQGKSIWTIVQRDGLEKARFTFLHEHFGWSFLDPEREDWESLKRDIHDLVDGYGLAYNDEPGGVWADPLQYEWAYVLDKSCLWVLHNGTPVSEPIPWDGPEPAWDAVEQRAYAL